MFKKLITMKKSSIYKRLIVIITILLIGITTVNATLSKTYDNRKIRHAVSFIYSKDTTFASTDTLELDPLQWDDGDAHSIWLMSDADTTKIYYQLGPFSGDSTTVWSKTKKHLFETVTTDSADYYAFRDIAASRYCKITIILIKATTITLRFSIQVWNL